MCQCKGLYMWRASESLLVFHQCLSNAFLEQTGCVEVTPKDLSPRGQKVASHSTQLQCLLWLADFGNGFSYMVSNDMSTIVQLWRTHILNTCHCHYTGSMLACSKLSFLVFVCRAFLSVFECTLVPNLLWITIISVIHRLCDSNHMYIFKYTCN